MPLLFELHEIWSVDSQKIIETVATRCQILSLECTKFNFGAGGDYSASPDPLAGFKGPTSKGREGKKGRKGGEGRGGKCWAREETERGERAREGGRRGKGKGKEGEERGVQCVPYFSRCLLATLVQGQACVCKSF